VSEADAPLDTPAQQLAAQLTELRAAGAEQWDSAGLSVVERLLTHAEQSPDAIAAHLTARARAHLERLEQDFAHARERGTRALDRLRASEHPGEPVVAQALLRGDTFTARRLMRRAPQIKPRLRDELRKNLADQLDAQAQARGISSPGVVDAPVAPARASTRPLAMAQSLYQDAAAGATARMTLAKTAASVPREAGRYHAVHIGARALEEAAQYPAYIKAVLSRLETLGVLWHHGALPPAPKAKKAEAKKAEPKKAEAKKPASGSTDA